MTARGPGGIAHWDEVEGRLVDRHGKRARWTALGSAAGSVDVGLVRLQIEPGCRPTPPHVHGAEEEIFYVLAGEGLSWQDGQTFEIRAGDCLVHRAGEEAHTLRGGEGGLDVLAFGQRIWTEAGYLPRGEVAWLANSWVRTGGGGHPWALDEEAGPLDFPLPLERPRRIVRAEDAEANRVEHGGSAYTIWDLARAGESDTTGLRYVQLDAGKLGSPPHCHSAEEELFVVLEGDGTLLLTPVDGQQTEQPVRRGHVVSRPAGTRVAHAFRAGEDGLTLLSYGTREPNDIAYYPRSGKVNIRGVGVIGRIERMGYWDGEE